MLSTSCLTISPCLSDITTEQKPVIGPCSDVAHLQPWKHFNFLICAVAQISSSTSTSPFQPLPCPQLQVATLHPQHQRATGRTHTTSKHATLRPPQRHALLHVPDSYKAGVPSPLIVALHGKEQPAREFEYHIQLSNAAFNPDSIVAYPEGVKLPWTGDPEAPPRDEVDDIGFVNVLLDYVMRDFSVDTARVYVVGFSNGGGLAALLACDARASGRVAGFAMSSAAVYQDEAVKEPLFSTCLPPRLPVPILEFHGDADPVIHYEGKTTPDGPTYYVYEWLQGWAKRNGCVDLEGKHTFLDGGKVEKTVWSTTSTDEENDRHVQNVQDVVEHYKIAGFGHGWPSRYPLNNDSHERLGPTYFDATAGDGVL